MEAFEVGHSVYWHVTIIFLYVYIYVGVVEINKQDIILDDYDMTKGTMVANKKYICCYYLLKCLQTKCWPWKVSEIYWDKVMVYKFIVASYICECTECMNLVRLAYNITYVQL